MAISKGSNVYVVVPTEPILIRSVRMATAVVSDHVFLQNVSWGNQQ